MNFERGYNLDTVEKNRVTLRELHLENHPCGDSRHFQNAVDWLIGRLHIDNEIEFRLAAEWVRDWTPERSRLAGMIELYEDADALPPDIVELGVLFEPVIQNTTEERG